MLPSSEDAKAGRTSVEDVTPAKLEEALKKTGGNRLEAASLLGISRSSLYRILRRMPTSSLPAQG